MLICYKFLLYLLSIFITLGATHVRADPIVTITETIVSPHSYYVFHVDPAGTKIDTIEITLDAVVGTFQHTETVPGVLLFHPPNTVPDTDVLGLSTAAFGWWVPANRNVDSDTQFAALGGTLGMDILGPVDFVQAVFITGGGGTYNFEFSSQGIPVSSLNGVFGVIPEPTTFALTLTALCLTMRRRRV